jgi:hypothetical protein
MARAASELCINHLQVKDKLLLTAALIQLENLLRSINLGRHTQSKEAAMRHLAAAAAALGLVGLALAPSGPAEAAGEDTTARLLTLKELSAPDQRGAAPVILRGSAVGPRRAPEVRPGAPQWQIAGGRRLWLLDPVNQEVRACAVFDTPDVGVQEIDCVSQSTSGFARTFGPAFNP